MNNYSNKSALHRARARGGQPSNEVQLFVCKSWYRRTELNSECTLKDLSNDI